MNVLLGLVGYAQSGKDTAAAHLVKEWDFARVAFADPLRAAIYELNPQVKVGWIRRRRVQDIVDELGWEQAKTKYTEIRRLLQVMGTDVGRMMFGENVWVDIADKNIRDNKLDNVVITDARFSNEIDYVKRNGGFTVRIVRPGYGPVNSHVSDTGIADLKVDHEIVNDGDVPWLNLQLDELMHKLCH